jgi:chromate transporter
MPEAKTTFVPSLSLAEIGRVFLLLGILGFGGPAAHIALMERELVVRRGWLTREQFLEMLAAVNLVPGPNSTEMAFYIGYRLAGTVGAILSGAGFIIPAVIASVALAMVYTTSGQTPIVAGLFAGLLPVILGLIASAGWSLARKAIDSTLMWVLLIVSLLLVLLNFTPLMNALHITPIYIPELLILLGVGFVYWVFQQRERGKAVALAVLPVLSVPAFLQVANLPDLPGIFFHFLVIGGTLFGSGYVIAAYLQRTFLGLGWMTSQQIADALIIGQSTPGPVLSTASAAGYIMTYQPGNLWSGVPGAIAATIGVFLPAFLIILVLGRLLPYLQRYKSVGQFLKGVNAGVIALIAGAFVNLAWGTLFQSGVGVNWSGVLLTIGAFFALERLKWSPLVLVILGIALGLVLTVLH